MKNLFFGVVATAFITLSSFNSAPVSKASNDDGCCTASNGSGQSVTICGTTSNCKRALLVYDAIFN